MTLAADIVVAAFREGNLTPIGQPPKAYEQAEGLAILNRYALSMFNLFVGEKLRDWQAPPSQRTAPTNRDFPLLPGAKRPLSTVFPTLLPINSRAVWDGSEQYLYLPANPQDGSGVALILGSGAAAANSGSLTIDGNGRNIGGAATYVVASTAEYAPAKWFYRADLGYWVQVLPVALTDETLFPVELDDLWICAVSIRLAPRYGKQVSESTALRLREMSSLLRSRYAQIEPTGSGGEELRKAYESFPVTTGWMD